MDKPLVLVQEADPAKGGGTLTALRAECPEELQPAIFDEDWPLTIWYRIEEFQLVSLKITAEARAACSQPFRTPLPLPTNRTPHWNFRRCSFVRPTFWEAPPFRSQ